MKPLSAGELNKRIALQYLVKQRGSLGEPLPDQVVTVGKVWAKAEPISNRKIRLLDQPQVVETYQFTLRPRTDVQQDWQIVLGDLVFTVRAMDRTQPDRLVITAEACTRNDRISH
ncbi:phage head closure protein [Edwardsiella tarda]|uniref:phage head closure protein n=1 Tax=Edwardsiella tarda TaxID=636 RepID=UPI002852BB02|nr:phage head closure protein [Edwardsiella tarda]UCQ18736.1 phage head closure protein [Edwardsiella tarda]